MGSNGGVDGMVVFFALESCKVYAKPVFPNPDVVEFSFKSYGVVHFDESYESKSLVPAVLLLRYVYIYH